MPELTSPLRRRAAAAGVGVGGKSAAEAAQSRLLEGFANVQRQRHYDRFRQSFLRRPNGVLEFRAVARRPAQAGRLRLRQRSDLELRLTAGDWTEPVSRLPPTGVRRVAYAAEHRRLHVPEDSREAIVSLLREFNALSGRESDVCELVGQLVGGDPPWSSTRRCWSRIIPRRSSGRNELRRVHRRLSAGLLAIVRRERAEGQGVARFAGGQHRHAAVAGRRRERTSLGRVSGWGGCGMRRSSAPIHFTNGVFDHLPSRFRDLPYMIHPVANVRLATLLQQFGLSARFAADAEQLTEGSPAVQPVDYAAAEPLLRAAIAKSRDYLRDAVCGTTICNGNGCLRVT